MRVKGAIVTRFDFGDVELGARKGAFRSPNRGVLVVPDKPRAGAPLVVVSHLRMPGCTGMISAYPCPRGRTELRMDHGMTYLGIDLARHGYSVLIPDLSPLWVGDTMARPYDQTAGWKKIVGNQRDRLALANRGRDRGFGAHVTRMIDMRKVGLAVHSRSSYIVPAAVTAWRRTSPIASVYSYGSALQPHDVPYPDVPFLGTVGSLDNDVKLTSVQWHLERLDRPRRTAGLVATVPGLGHTYVNRTLSERKIDERAACERGCPDAGAHERFLQTSTAAWFDATLRNRRNAMPVTATSPLPTRLAGREALWLAATNARAHSVYRGTSRLRGVTRIGDGKVIACRRYEAMDLEPHRDRCPEAKIGVTTSQAAVAHLTLTRSGGARFTTTPTSRVRQVVLNLNPADTRTDTLGGTPLRLTLVDARGGRHVQNVSRLNPALKDRRTAEDNGAYALGTIRLPARGVGDAPVVAVELTGGSGSGQIDVERIQLVTG